MMQRLALVIVIASLTAGCAASRAFGRGEGAARTGDWDTAVEFYRQAVQEAPERADYRIAFERAMINAANLHLDQARVFEARGQLEEALREYRRASEYDPTNRLVATKVLDMERRIRDLAEASRPRPSIQQMRDVARQQAPPLLNPASRDPIDVVFNNASVRDILNSIGMAAGINITYERDFQDRPYTVNLRGVTFEEALSQILSANTLFYKVINGRTIMVIPDNAQKRAAYEEQVIRTFFISHADATELVQTLNQVIRIPAIAVQPVLAANKTANTITVRGTANVVSIIEKMIEANDNPRAELIIDVQILEVNRGRAREFGLDLGNYTINAGFSPERSGITGASAGDDDTPATPAGVTSTPFNLNTITRGISTADFYLSVPSAVVRFLESDTETRLIAKPQLRGAEGQKITLNLGDEVPVPSTVFTPVAQGGASFNPLTSFNYRTIGVIVEMTPRVTFENEIILDLLVESSTLGDPQTVGGQALPSFGARRVSTRLRLRDGESNLLAGLIREDQRRIMTGIPGLLRIPILRSLFASNSTDLSQTDIVMLLTPRIVRTHELTQTDVSPIYIGTQQALGLGGPPPLIAAQPETAPPPAPAGAQAVPTAPVGAIGAGTPAPVTAPAAGTPAPSLPTGTTTVPQPPPGSSPIPGTTTTPVPPSPPQGTPAQPVPPVPTPNEPPQSAAPPPAASPAPPTASTPAATPATAGGGQVFLSPPGTDFRVGGGPYTVPVSITGASMVSGATLTITFNPSALRVRAIQEGSFMRSGGVNATFTQQVDAAAGRIDIAIVRAGDATGVSGTGLLAAILFDAVGGGAANLTVTGAGTGPRGTPVSLAFAPVPMVSVR
jgi:type II secretory pathway component GspD/PulD (secretin)